MTISGMRPAPRREHAAPDSTRDTSSVWLSAVGVAWSLALTPGAVIASRFGFFLVAFMAVTQVALIVLLLMRFAWGQKIPLLVLGIGLLFSALPLTMISYDRSQYRGEIERFDTTIRGVVERPGD